MDIALYIISAILLIIGFVGCIVPVLPGTPLALIGLILLHFTDAIDFTTAQFVTYILLTIVAQVTDYIFPIWFTKKFGGSKWGMWGSTAGLIIGLFFGPIGIIVGPIIGAFVGEVLSGKEFNIAIKAAIGSFIGFLTNTGLKLIVCGYFIWSYFHHIWG